MKLSGHGRLTLRLAMLAILVITLASPAAALAAPRAGNPAAPASQNAPSLGQFLAADGTLRATNYTGSIDARGYHLVSEAHEAPRFAPDAPNGVSPWDTTWTINGPLDKVLTAVADGNGGVYLGGKFGVAGSVPANNIVHWDAASGWSALGSGTNDEVYALALTSTRKLYVGGNFLTAGGVVVNHIAKYDPAAPEGSRWSALGSGVNNPVQALAVDSSNNLYAAGSFTNQGNNIARWNGTAWSALGNGLDGTVNALAVSSTGVVYAGGAFTVSGGDFANPINHVAYFDTGTTRWLPLGSGASNGTSGTVMAVAFDGNGRLYVGGSFASAGGTSVKNVAMWAGGTWSALGGGTPGANLEVDALAVDATNNLYVGGQFTTVGAGTTVNYVAKWNGSTTWSRLGTAANPGTNWYVRALAFSTSNRYLYVGGEFKRAGGLGASRAAIWSTTGSAWSQLGTSQTPDGTVRAMAMYRDAGGNSTVCVGGEGQSAMPTGFFAAGGTLASGLACWNGSIWSTRGTGVAAIVGRVYALAFDADGNLYAGGDFTSPAYFIAKWNGTSWEALDNAGGLDGAVYALAFDAAGNLYAGGEFASADGNPATGLARWDGAAWSSIEGLTDAGGSSSSVIVYALALDPTGRDQALYAGGNFAQAEGVTVNGIARYQPGTGWSALDGGMSSGATIHALAFDGNGYLYAGGDFTSAGSTIARYVAMWGQARWMDLSGDPGGIVYSLAVSKSNTVYAGGVFTNHISSWNPGTRTWTALNGGADDTVYALATDDLDLYAGGAFLTVNTNTTVSTYVAHLTEAPYDTYADPNEFCGGNQPCFNTFGGAINAVSQGRTVHVYQGTYAESISIDGDFAVLIGDDGGNVVLNGSFSTAQAAVAVVGSRFRIKYDFNLVSGDFKASPSVFEVGRNFRNSGGNFNHNGGTVLLTGDGETNQQMIDGNPVAFNNLRISSGTTVEIIPASSPIVEGRVENYGTLVQGQTVPAASSQDFLMLANGRGGYSYYGLNINNPGGSPMNGTTVRIAGNQACAGATGGATVKRCYNIGGTTVPAAADVRFYYTAGELPAGQNAQSLNAWYYRGGANWQELASGARGGCTDGAIDCYVQGTAVGSAAPSGGDFALQQGSPLDTKLAAFTASPRPSGVMLAWETVSELQNQSYNVYQATAAEGPWTKINTDPIPSQAPGAPEGHSYSFLASAPEAGSQVYYRLEVIGLDDSASDLGTTNVLYPAVWVFLPTVAR